MRPIFDKLEDRRLLSAIYMTPARIQQAYELNLIAELRGHYNQLAGKGEHIAIVDAYSSPTIQSDVATFDAKYKLPACNLHIVNRNGADPAGQWDFEEALDIEWAHAVAPAAEIDYFSSSTANVGLMLFAEQDALLTPHEVAVSNSWGTSAFAGDGAYAGDFIPYSGFPAVVMSSSGDNGMSDRLFPADHTIAIGGTTLAVSGTGKRLGERLWAGSGPGAAVTYNADPVTGFPTVVNGSWYLIGGTSASSPQWAAYVAIVDSIRANHHLQPFTNATLAPQLRHLPNADFNTYKGQEGRGSLRADRLTHDLENVKTHNPTGRRPKLGHEPKANDGISVHPARMAIEQL